MNFVRRRLRLFSVAAFVAVLALALVPSVSRALSASAGFDPLAEVCTTGGLANEGGAGIAAAHPDHCPLCAMPAVLPPAAQVAAVDAPVPIEAAPAPQNPTVALRPWAHAPPRAPPAPSC